MAARVQRNGRASVVLGGPTSDVPIFAAANPTWQTAVTAAASFETSRVSGGVGTLAGGGILVFGGNVDGDVSNSAVQYDYTGSNTHNAASLHTSRYLFGYATDENHHVYAIGGKNSSGVVQTSVEVYNSSTNAWSTIAPLPTALYGLSAAADDTGHVFAFGGSTSTGAISSSVYRYTIATNTWDTETSLPTATDNSAAVLGSNGKIYVLGGITNTGATASVESYSPTTNSWTGETSLPVAVDKEAVTVDSLGRLVVAGGYGTTGAATAAVYVSQQLNQADALPVITSTAPTSVIAGMLYSYQVLSTGNPQPTYSLTAAPAGMTIDTATGLITWTPTLSQVGSQTITVQASNFAGQTTQTFSVNAALSLPVFTTGSTLPQSVVNQNSTFTIAATGTPAPTFSLSSAPTGMTIDPATGVVNWTPSVSQEAIGASTFTVQATNYSGSTSKTFSDKVARQRPPGLRPRVLQPARCS